MTPVVGLLIAANVAMFVLFPPWSWVTDRFSLIPDQLVAEPWTAVTYMFLHASVGHLFFNMLSLFFFGPQVERRLGPRAFATLYLMGGLMGAICSLGTPSSRIVGASGAIFAVLLAFAWFWPRERIYLWGILGIEARVMVVMMTVLSLWGGMSNARDGTAHLAHLGGFVGGWIYLKWNAWRSPAARWKRTLAAPPVRAGPRLSLGSDVERWKKLDLASLHPINREEYQRVLDKLAAEGAGALTPGEREFLERFARG